MTLPQIRQGIAMIVREAFPCGTMAHRLEERPKRWRRNELARFYHWKRRNQWLHETYRNDCSKTPVKTVELMCYPILPMARRALGCSHRSRCGPCVADLLDAPLTMPLIHGHIHRFQCAYSVARPLPGGVKRDNK